MWQDVINGSFELFGGVFAMLNCYQLRKDKKVRGVSFIAVGYFAVWGFWNMYYYPVLKQWMSLLGGLLITAVNVLYIGMLIYYIRKEKLNGEFKMSKEKETKIKFKVNDLVEVVEWNDDIKRDWIIVDFASNGGEAIIRHIIRDEQTVIELSKLKLQMRSER